MEDADLTIGLLAAKFDDEYPDSAPEWVADTAIRNTSAAIRRTLLARLLEDRIRARRREHIRTVEQTAAASERWPGLAEVERRERAAEDAEDLEKHRADFLCETPHQTITAAKSCAYRLVRTGELDDRKLQRDDPEEWERQNPSPWESFRNMMEDYRSRVRLELTTELLGSSFALGDGRRVTWGTATEADHRQRIQLLQRQATGTAQTMILHEKAIEILTERSAACLNDARVAA